MVRHVDAMRERPPQSFDNNDACDHAVVPHHVPVVSGQRWEGFNLTARGRASILKTNSLTAPIQLIAAPPRRAVGSFRSPSGRAKNVCRKMYSSSYSDASILFLI